MSATTSSINTPSQGVTQVRSLPAAAVKIPSGVLVNVTTATGHVTNAANATGVLFVGVSQELCDNSAGAAAAKEVKIAVDGAHEMAFSSIAITDILKQVYVTDNQTVGYATTTYNVKCGTLVKYISSTRGLVDIGHDSKLAR